MSISPGLILPDISCTGKGPCAQAGSAGIAWSNPAERTKMSRTIASLRDGMHVPGIETS